MHDKKLSAPAAFEPSLRMELRPGFRCCAIPNPNGLAKCPACGGPAPPSSFYDADDVTITLPLATRASFAVARWLLNLAKKIERIGK